MNAPSRHTRFAKIVVKFERRPDGGLRAFSDDVPGFVLSNPNPEIVLAEIIPTLEFMLSGMWGVSVSASRLDELHNPCHVDAEFAQPSAACHKEYVAFHG